MQPTLRTGNIVLVWRLPQTWAELTNSQYIPARSNLVVVKKLAVSNEQLVKRVIGLPGDTIKIADGRVIVYNQQHPNGFDPDNAPYGRLLLPTGGVFSTYVSDGQLFVMGDNRQQGASLDSRSSLGNITSSDLVGKVVIRIYPLNQIKLF
jgi:signal peptidase I